MTSIEDKVKRPVKYLIAISRRHPGLWKLVDQVRASRSQIAHEWPTWCYLPTGAVRSILNLDPLSKQVDSFRFRTEVHFVATFAAWRVAKDIYIFDETVFEELWNTPIEGKIPIEVLHRLPTFCAYIAFPSSRDLGYGGACHGFFVHIDYSRVPVLQMSLDMGGDVDAGHIALATYGVELHEGKDLLQCLEVMVDRMTPGLKDQLAERFKQLTPEQREEAVAPGAFKSIIEPLVSLTVYLCSTSAEIKPQDPFRGLRREAYSKKTKDGIRTFVPEQPRIWEVAYRIGATLRAAASAEYRGADGDGTHARPRPHMRKAHWHHFWIGPKAAAGKPEVQRELVVKWIPPIAVAMGPDGEIVPTVHRVTR